MPQTHKKRTKRDNVNREGEAVAIPLSEKGRLECRKLAFQEEWRDAKLFWNTQCSQPKKAVRLPVP